MKIGALIYVRPAQHGLLLYRMYCKGERHAYLLADEANADGFGAQCHLQVVHRACSCLYDLGVSRLNTCPACGARK